MAHGRLAHGRLAHWRLVHNRLTHGRLGPWSFGSCGRLAIGAHGRLAHGCMVTRRPHQDEEGQVGEDHEDEGHDGGG